MLTEEMILTQHANMTIELLTDGGFSLDRHFIENNCGSVIAALLGLIPENERQNALDAALSGCVDEDWSFCYPGFVVQNYDNLIMIPVYSIVWQVDENVEVSSELTVVDDAVELYVGYGLFIRPNKNALLNYINERYNN